MQEVASSIASSHFISIIIIIIKKGWQCKAGRDRLTPYQSEYPNPTAPTHRMKEGKGKTAGDKKWAQDQFCQFYLKRALFLIVRAENRHF